VKKKVTVAFAVGLFVAIVLWILGFADEFHRLNLFIIEHILEKIGELFG